MLLVSYSGSLQRVFLKFIRSQKILLLLMVNIVLLNGGTGLKII